MTNETEDETIALGLACEATSFADAARTFRGLTGWGIEMACLRIATFLEDEGKNTTLAKAVSEGVTRIIRPR